MILMYRKYYMTNKYTINESATILDALKAMDDASHNSQTLFVTNDKEVMVGTLTDGDIRRGLIGGAAITDSVSTVMHKSFKFLRAGDNEAKFLKEYRSRLIFFIPVLDAEGHILRVCNLVKYHNVLPIDAVLMAGGKGERLRPLTEKTPKPLLPVGDKAIIDYLTDIDNWTDIIDLSVGAGLIIGLKSDGKLVSTAYLKHRTSLDFLSWSDIVAIYAASSTIYGLRSDGTVISAGYNKDASKDQSLRDLVAISGVNEGIFGLKANGTVVLHGNNDWHFTDMLRQLKRWNNIVAIASSYNYNAVPQYFIAGITDNGIVKWTASGIKDFELFNKKLFSSVSWIDKEYQSAREKVAKERQQRITELQEEKNKLHVEYRNLKGLFAGHRRKEIDIRIAAIDKELKKLEN